MKNIRNMPSGNHFAVLGCNNDQRYLEKQIILPHVEILKLYLPKNKQDLLSWNKAFNCDKFKVTMTTKVCMNHFVQG